MDNTHGKLQTLRRLFKHHNASDEQPPSRGRWLLVAIGVLAIAAAVGLYFAIVLRTWQAVATSPVQPSPFAAAAPEPSGFAASSRGVPPGDEATPAVPAAALLERLGNADVGVQRAALRELSNRKPVEPEFVAAAITCLKQAELRVAAAAALAKMGVEAYDAVELLALVATETRSPRERAATVAALLRIDPFRVVELPPEIDSALVALLSHEDDWTRRYAAYCLGAREADADDVVAALRAATRNPELEQAARLALSQIRPDSPVNQPTEQELLERLEGSHWDYGAAEQLIARGPGAAGRLVEYLAAQNSNVVSGQPTHVAKSWGAAALPAYIAALESGDRALATKAALLLIELGPEAARAVPALVKRLQSADGRPIRGYVIGALQEIGPEARQAIGPLEQFRSDNGTLPLNVAVALYCIDPTPERLQAAWELIEPNLPDGPDLTSDHTLHELLELRPVPAELLVGVLEASPDRFTRRLVAKALCEHPDRSAAVVDKLAKLLSHEPAPKQTFDENPSDTASLAADVLAAIGPPANSATDALIEQLDSPSWRFRVSVIRALGRVATPKTAEKIKSALKRFRRSQTMNESTAADFALRRMRVEVIGSGAQLSPQDRAFYESITPYSLRNPVRQFQNWRPPADPLADPPTPLPPAGTLADLLLAAGRWRESGGLAEVEQLVLAAGEGGAAVRPAAPLLLGMLYEHDGYERSRRACIHALWRLTRSPLMAAVMVDTGVVAPESIREMGPLAGSLGPFLIGRLQHSGVGTEFQVSDNLPGGLSLPLIGPRTRESVPLLRGMLVDSDGGVAGPAAALCLWRIEQDPSVIPHLIRQLKPSHEQFVRDEQGDASRQYVAWALGRIGPPAKEAVPLLAEAAYLDSREFGVAAAWALTRIDPEAARQWGVPSL
jgi:HEAT repeat protein